MANMDRDMMLQSLYTEDFKMGSRLKKFEWMKCVFNFLIFVSLLGWVFVHTTYLFRNCNSDREHVIGIRNEKAIDVVCIGGSSTFVYWEPYLAWKEYGMTSYNLATNSAIPPVIDGYTRYLMKIHKPAMVVIDVRSYIGGVGTVSNDEGAIRNMTDSLPISTDRFWAITKILNYYDAFQDENADIVSFYFDIAKYHGIYEKLGSEINWNYRDNDFRSMYKGFEFVDNPCHAIVQEMDNQTKERMELDLKKEKSLRDLLEYLHKNKVEALFVAGPVPTLEEGEMQYNTIGDIVSSYGYSFINTNHYYKEMGIDFTKDFYNVGHVNVYGAEKYTRFVSGYIKDHYAIADHRGEEIYSEWDEAYSAAKEKEASVKELIDQQADTKKKAYKKGCALKGIKDSLARWCDMVLDENYTVLALANGDIPDVGFHLPGDIRDDDWDGIKIFTGNTMIYESDTALDEDYKGTLGSDFIEYSINSGVKSKLIVDGKVYKTQKEGIYMLVFDNNYNQILDAVIISGNKDGYVWEHLRKAVPVH